MFSGRFVGVMILLAGSVGVVRAADPIPGEVGWHSVARTSLNTFTGAAFAFGYYSLINGIPESVFKGPPSEKTAYFSFRGGVVNFSVLPQNGTQLATLVPGATFNIYFNPNPNRDWYNPDSFTQGQLVATYIRTPFMLAQAGSMLTETFSAYLLSSSDFVLNGKTYNFKDLVPGITNTNTFDVTGNFLGSPLFPLPGFDTLLPVGGVGVKIYPPPGYKPQFEGAPTADPESQSAATPDQQ